MTRAAAVDVAWTAGLLCLTVVACLALAAAVAWAVEVVFTVETLMRWCAELTA